ncbi:MAG TPA: hypothetical protein VM032_13550 [Vicinamibacterales bacterium]|nr:hypothetical protein [Vicinamibacterales bacterium]
MIAFSAGLRGTDARLLAQRGAAQATPSAVNGIDGTWNFSTLTPLERPAEFNGRGTITLAEAARYEQQVIERNNADRRDGPVEADVARAYNDAWFDRGTRLAVLNGQARTSLIVDPPDGRLPPLTADAARRQSERAQARRDHPADGPEDRSLAERCLSFNAGPPVMPGPYNNYLQIFVFADHVIIFNEMIHDARIIPTDGRRHAAAGVRRFMGDSIGRWEGRTLVVDTVNFTDKTSFRGASERLHLVERFTRVDADTLLYQFEVDDATAFTRPWRAELPMQATTEAIFEYACHEGNHALAGILGGARYEERQAGGRGR